MPRPPALDTAAASLQPAIPSIGAAMTGCLICSRSVSRVDMATCATLSQRLDGLARHQVIGIFPTGERAHALTPDLDVRVALGPIVAMLSQRIKQVTCDRKVGDGWPVAQHKFARRQMLVEDARRCIETALQERQHAGIGRLWRERLQEAIAGEIA